MIRDFRKYHHHLDGLGMTDEQKDEFARTMIGALESFLDNFLNASAETRREMVEQAELSRAETPEQAYHEHQADDQLNAFLQKWREEHEEA